MEFILLLPVTFLVIIIFFLLNKRKVRVPPGPPGLPLIGNLLQLDTSKLPHEHFSLISKQYGPLISLKLGSKPILVVSSAKLAEEVMKKQDQIFCSRPELLALQKLSYNGMDIGCAPYNDSSKEMKKISVQHLFSVKSVQSFRPIREDEVSLMIKRISKEASDQSTLINITESALSVINTITSRIAFGKRYDGVDQEKKGFFSLMEEAEALIVSFCFSDYFPLIGWLDKLTGAITRMDTICEKLDLFYQEVIDNHLDINRPKSKNNDIIDILLQLREDKSTAIDLTMDHIKGVLMNIFFAGTETSAATIVWAMTALSKHPFAMKKVQEEVRELVGNKGTVDEDDCTKLPYLKAVIKETMRMYPPTPLLFPRETRERCTIDGYEIQPKTMVYVNVWEIGRSSDNWEKPNEFLPERFLNSTIDVKGQDYVLAPFGAGRRKCPGISMGLANVALVLANLLYLFNWSLPNGMKEEDISTDALPGITMSRKDALLLHANNYYLNT